MANRLPLQHRIITLAIVLVACIAIIVWGYVLNVGTLRVTAQPGDQVLVDGDAFSGEGEVRAGTRRVRVEREHFVPFNTTVDVPRKGLATVAPELVFQPYSQESAEALYPLLPLDRHAEVYRETPGRLMRYPTASSIFAQPALSEAKISRMLFSDDFLGMWVSRDDGKEFVQMKTEAVVEWSGTTAGRGFAGSTFIGAFTKGAGTEIARLESDGSLTTIGSVDGQGSFTIVPAPLGDQVLAISDETGVATLVGPTGRTKLALTNAALDARWSPDASFLLLQVRPPGANAVVRLASYEIATGKEILLDVRAPIALATFVADYGVVALERVATAETAREEVQRQLTDARAQKLVNDVEDKLLPFAEFQDMLPAELGAQAMLVRLDPATGVRTDVSVLGVELTSETVRLDAGATPGTLLALTPKSLVTIILVAPPSAQP